VATVVARRTGRPPRPTWIEAGAARDRFADDLHVFLTADGVPVDYYTFD
jgi:hypothetical protein